MERGKVEGKGKGRGKRKGREGKGRRVEFRNKLKREGGTYWNLELIFDF